MSKVIVIGGGAAGMMAAICAANSGHEVTLLEKNEKLGKKLFITGKGRCNVTNACDVEELFQNMVSNAKFMYSAFYGFDNQACMDFFEKLGVRLKVERGNRVFPKSDHASDIISALSYELRRLGVTVLLQHSVSKLVTEPIAYQETQSKEIQLQETQHKKTHTTKEPIQSITGVVCTDNAGKKTTFGAQAVILATGGVSYPLTGSTGDGQKLAAQTGHKVTELYPALVPLCMEEKWCGELMGMSLKNVSVTIKQDKKELYHDFGEMLFTHYGVSGPLILSASSYITKKCVNAGMKLYIDLKPALTREQLDRRLLREFEENHKKQFKNTVHSLFPAKLIPIMISMSGIDPEKKVNEISKEERLKFVELIKAVPLTIKGTSDFKEAIITQGGISVKDVNPSTMESKKVSGLYFAGEIMDLDALTGGFNLQIAWSTAYLAGTSIL